MENIINGIVKYASNTSNLISLIIGVVIVLVFSIFKNQISKGVLNLLSKILYKNSKDKANSLKESLKTPLSFLIATLAWLVAFAINYTNASIIKFFKVLIILIVSWGIISYLSNNLFVLLHFSKENDSTNSTALKFISNILKIVIIAFAVVMVISELGYNINGLLTGLGVGGLAVSLAAQEAVSNLISGFIIVFEKPFKVGDHIQTSSIEGYVEEVAMRTTRIRTLDDSVITVPNSTLTKDAVINISMMDKRRINMSFGLTYSTSNETIEKIRDEISTYIIENPDILPNPLRIHFTTFDDSSLKFEVVCYTETSDLDEYLEICNRLNLKIKEIVENSDTDFAFPTSTVYVKN